MEREIEVRLHLPVETRKVRVELPFYWQHDVTPDSGSRVIWRGRLNENLSQDEICLESEECTLRISPARSVKILGCGTYITDPQYKSTKEEFDSAIIVAKGMLWEIKARGEREKTDDP